MIALTIPANVVDRLAWSLAHSVWQFALLAVVALAFDHAMRRRSASARYWVLLGAFGVMAATPMITFFWLPVEASIVSRAADPNQEIATSAPASTPAPAPVIMMLPPIEKANLTTENDAREMSLRERVAESWEGVSSALRPWSTQIVWAWLVGVAVFSLRPLLSWRAVRRLRVVGVSPVPAGVRRALERMAQRLRMRQAVEALESALVKGPVVVGYLRPLILLPIGSLAQLPSSQLEAILAHELAHVRRHDYLVNLLQALAETVYFYHPAIWWLSRRIRDERENCCDDIAAGAIGDRVGYGRALLAIEELRAATPSLALGAQDGSLLSRIGRLIEREPAPQRFGGSAVVSGLLAIAAMVVGVWTVTLADDSAVQAPVPSRVSSPAGIIAVAGDQAEAKSVVEDAKPQAQEPKQAEFQPLKDRARSFDIIVAEHVFLWDGEIATWEQVVDFLRKIRKARNSPFHANFYFTNGAHKAGRWNRYKDAVMEIYRELFEPAGVSFGSISPRASQRYDAVNIAVDLVPKPKNLRRGIVVNAFDGEPVHYALVVALPEDAMMPVMLERRDLALRDPLDEVWTRTDREGRFEIEAPDSGYRLAIWDRSGFALMSVPPTSQTPTIALGRLGHLELQSVAGAKQTINVNVHPAGMPDSSPGFALYGLPLDAEPLWISLPSGKVTVSRSLDQGNGSSLSVPVETFSLEAGRTQSLTILPAKPVAK